MNAHQHLLKIAHIYYIVDLEVRSLKWASLE